MVRRVTGFDVARAAGVAQPTVSRALRNLPGVSPETRDRVLAAARELSYIPSDRGRSLSMSSTRRVAVVSEELTNPFYPELVEPVREALAAHGFRTVVVTDTDGEVTLDALADGSYDAVVLTTTLRRSTLPRDLSERGVPHVLVNRILDHAESPSCAIDNRAGARDVAGLVAGLGHRLVGLIHGPVEASTGRERSEGVTAGMRERGVPVRRELTRRVPFGHDEGRAAALDLLGLRKRPTALVCGNDVLAFGAMSAARSLGLRVPEDLTIIGFDDIPMSGWPMVGLTTVRCDLRGMARLGVELLLEILASRTPEPGVRRLRPQLVLRSTHGPRPGSRAGGEGAPEPTSRP